MIDMAGKKCGKLTVIKFSHLDQHRQAAWICECDCGKSTTICGALLRNGNTISCGCYRRERAKEAATKHGRKGDRIYNSWAMMCQRCLNEDSDHFPYYGARGIIVCSRWRGEEGFKNFLADMGERPIGASIDRIDNDGNYEPSNCRWATSKRQARNRGNNRFVTISGKSMLFIEACEIYNVNYGTASDRMKRGWSPEETFTGV